MKILTADATGERRNALQFNGVEQQNNTFVLQLFTYDLSIVLDVTHLTGNGHALTITQPSNAANVCLTN